jgi:predicted RNA-binding protein with PIN domain
MLTLPDCLRVPCIPITIPRHRHQQQRHRGTLLTTCARGRDGKRPKKSASDQPGGQSDSPAAASTPPPRIQIASLVPVATQIRIVREVKKIEASSYRKAPRTLPYRKETKEPEEYREERAKAEAVAVELSKNESKNFALSKLYKTAESSSTAVLPPPVLLVDGYNVLHKWERTSSFMRDSGNSSDSSGSGSDCNSIDLARDILIEALGVYSQTNGIRVIVAFDAMNGSAVGVEEQILSTGVTVAYTGNCEADSFIEAQVDFWLQRRHPYIVVATSDIAQKAVVDSKTGPDKRQFVFVVPSSGLCKDIEATEKRLEQQLEDLAMRPVARGILGSAVKFKNKSAFTEMQKMRMTMPTASTLPPLAKLKGLGSSTNNKSKSNNSTPGGQPKPSGEKIMREDKT